jgi:hypothetical protein
VVPESQPWSPPAPIRALIWWPPISLLLFVVAPDSAPWAVTLTGAGLTVLGMTGPALARAVARLGARPTAAVADPARAVARLGAEPAATVADPRVAGDRSTAHDLPTERPHAA